MGIAEARSSGAVATGESNEKGMGGAVEATYPAINDPMSWCSVELADAGTGVAGGVTGTGQHSTVLQFSHSHEAQALEL